MFSLVIPAYNEEARIGKTLGAYHAMLSRRFTEFEIIVVTDGSTDRTNEIVRKFANEHKRVRLLDFAKRLGKGGGVIEGFKAAKGDIAGFVDADNSVDVSQYERLLDALDGNAAAISSRYIRGTKWLKPEPLRIIIASRIFNILVNALFLLGIWDTQCGGKVFQGDVIKKIVPKMVSKSFAFDVELVWRAKKLGKVKEIGIVWEHDPVSSKTRLRDFYKLLFDVLRVRFSWGN